MMCAIKRLCCESSRCAIWKNENAPCPASVTTSMRSFASMKWMIARVHYMRNKGPRLRLRLIDSVIVCWGFTSFSGAHGDPRHYGHGGSASLSGCWLSGINQPPIPFFFINTSGLVALRGEQQPNQPGPSFFNTTHLGPLKDTVHSYDNLAKRLEI